MPKAVIPMLQTLRRLHLDISLDDLKEDPLAGLFDKLEEISGMKARIYRNQNKSTERRKMPDR